MSSGFPGLNNYKLEKSNNIHGSMQLFVAPLEKKNTNDYATGTGNSSYRKCGRDTDYSLNDM